MGARFNRARAGDQDERPVVADFDRANPQDASRDGARVRSPYGARVRSRDGARIRSRGRTRLRIVHVAPRSSPDCPTWGCRVTSPWQYGHNGSYHRAPAGCGDRTGQRFLFADLSTGYLSDLPHLMSNWFPVGLSPSAPDW